VKNNKEFLKKNSEEIASFYAKAQIKIIDNLMRFGKVSMTKPRAGKMLEKINEVIEELDEETKKWIAEKLPESYKKFGNEAKKQIRLFGYDVGDEFAVIHTRAVQTLADDSYLRFARSMTAINEVSEEIINFGLQKEIREEIASGLITGEARKEISEDIARKIKNEGITVLVDKGGKRWQLNNYTRMLAITTMSNAGNQGAENILIENNFDVVQVSNHGTICPLCLPYEGRYLSLTGKTKGLTTISEARSNHFQHPNCLHSFSAVNPNDYKKAQAEPKPKPLNQEEKKKLNDILKENDIKGNLQENLSTEDKRQKFYQAQRDVKKEFK